MALTAKRVPVKNVRVTENILVRGEHTVKGNVLKTGEQLGGDVDITEDEAKDIVGAGRGEFTDEKPVKVTAPDPAKKPEPAKKPD